MTKWEIETIPCSDTLYFRIHENQYRQVLRANKAFEGLFPNHFCSAGGYHSVDWDKYSSAACLQKKANNPCQNGVVEFLTGEVRKDGHQVEHSPTKHNQAHSAIYGKEALIRVTLGRIARWCPGFEIEMKFT